jgi:hypothetical protein
MTEVPDAAKPPAPPGPKAAGKSVASKLKGQPKWVYVAAFGVFLGVAYLAWKKSHAEPPPEDPGALSDVSPDTGLLTGDYTYPDPTQGAGGFFGGDSPVDTSDDAGSLSPINIYVGGQPGSIPNPANGDVPAAATPAPTGGGLPSPVSAATRQAVVQTFAGVPYQVSPGETPRPLAVPTAASALAAKSLLGSNIDMHSETPPPGFPHKGPHGWYRNERDSKGPYHLYQSGQKVRV